MSCGRAFAFSTLAVATLVALPADGQSVISTRSGLIHFFEGTVYLGAEPLQPHPGRFPCMAQGSELRTAQGRAEVLLTPGVFLRMGESSAIRLVANNLADTRVELLEGAAIIDSAEPSSGTSVTLMYKAWKMRLLQKGMYRIDSQPPRLLVVQGEAEVASGAEGTPVSVKEGMDLPLAGVLVPERASGAPRDSLANWDYGRNESIAADNAITAQIDEDPSSVNSSLAQSGFTYFPMIGLSPSYGSYGLNQSGAYSGALTPYQSGFSSLYLPGYTYRPFILGLGLGLRPGGYRGYLYSSPVRTGFTPGARTPGTRTFVPAPMPHPTTPPARPVTRGVMRGGHR
jgi:hypothetical protein